MTDLLPSLRTQLLEAAERQVARRRRPQRRLVLAAAAAVVAVVLLAAGLQVRTAGPAAAGVDVTVTAGQVTVRLTELEHRPGLIQAAVRKAGLDVNVVAVPTGPSRVGRFLSYSESGAALFDLKKLDDDGASFDGFVLPEGWPGHMDLRVGRPAEKDEPYVGITNAYAVGEPLHCSGIYGLAASEAARKLPKGKVSFEFQGIGSLTAVPQRVAPGDVGTSPVAAFRVSDAVALSATRVQITVTPDGKSVAIPPSTPGNEVCP